MKLEIKIELDTSDPKDNARLEQLKDLVKEIDADVKKVDKLRKNA